MGLKDIIKTADIRGDFIIVRNLNKEFVARYDLYCVTVDWLMMSNDVFDKLYGFSFVPPADVVKRATKEVNKRNLLQRRL